MIKREQWLQLTEVDITYLNAHALESQLLAELGVLFFSLSNKEIQQLADSFLSAAAINDSGNAELLKVFMSLKVSFDKNFEAIGIL